MKILRKSHSGARDACRGAGDWDSVHLARLSQSQQREYDVAMAAASVARMRGISRYLEGAARHWALLVSRSWGRLRLLARWTLTMSLGTHSVSSDIWALGDSE